MKATVLLSLATVLVLLPASAQGQRNFDNVVIKTHHVAGHVHMLEGSGGNIGVSVGADGILMIDDQFAPLADKIRKALKELGEGKLKFLLNTHWHGDHTGGNTEFGPEAPIIAHSNVRKRLSTQQQVAGRVHEPLPAQALPVITFDESLSLHFNGEEIKAVHYPHGHTDGDTVIFFTGSNVVHMGDLFFAERFPFVDLNSGGDVEGLISNIKDVIDRTPAGARIIPGHGSISTLDGLKAYHRMLIETTEIVRKRLAAGDKLDEVKKAGLPEKWKSWGEGFISTERWLESVYESLSKNSP